MESIIWPEWSTEFAAEQFDWHQWLEAEQRIPLLDQRCSEKRKKFKSASKEIFNTCDWRCGTSTEAARPPRQPDRRDITRSDHRLAKHWPSLTTSQKKVWKNIANPTLLRVCPTTLPGPVLRGIHKCHFSRVMAALPRDLLLSALDTFKLLQMGAFFGFPAQVIHSLENFVFAVIWSLNLNETAFGRLTCVDRGGIP